MLTDFIKYFFLFFAACFMQVIVFDNIFLGSHVHIFFYVIFILLLPIEINKYLIMTLGFILGLCVDLFNNTPGLHAFACVMIAFVRPFVLRIYAPRDGYIPNEKPKMENYGFLWFFKYAATLLLIHNISFFYLEFFKFGVFFLVLMKSIISTAASILLIILAQMLFFKIKK